jgi:hypothetical protein
MIITGQLPFYLVKLHIELYNDSALIGLEIILRQLFFFFWAFYNSSPQIHLAHHSTLYQGSKT